VAVKKLKDDKGREYEVDIDDDDDDDDDGEPYIDVEELKGHFNSWLDEREKSKQSNPPSESKPKPKGVRIKTAQKPPETKPNPRHRRLRLA